jgi:hypothetical protein
VSKAFRKHQEDLIGLDLLHGACLHLKNAFSVTMSREEAQSNLGARVILFNCSNEILREHSMGITDEEVESFRILERSGLRQ